MDATVLIVVLAGVALVIVLAIKMKPPEPKPNITSAVGDIAKLFALF